LRAGFVKAIVVGAALVTWPTPAGAQTSPELGVSYGILRIYEETAPFGFAVDVSKPFSAVGAGMGLGVIGEFALNQLGDIGFDRDITQTTFMGGVRVGSIGQRKVRPFGQFLLGGLKWTDFDTDFAVQPGAGIRLTLHPRFDVRVQVDFPIDFFEGTSETGYRFNLGVVIPMGL
jgi:hypothetical protein